MAMRHTRAPAGIANSLDIWQRMVNIAQEGKAQAILIVRCHSSFMTLYLHSQNSNVDGDENNDIRIT